MSNVGQGLTALVGGVIGYFIGGPQGALYGFEAGLAVGTLVSPTKLPGVFGPKLTDGQTTTASVGDPISFGYGFFAVSGTVIYLGVANQQTTTTSSGSKGAPSSSQTTYSYTQSIAIGLCEGPVGSMRRVWENGELVYDIRPQQPGETDDAFSARLAGNATYAATFVLYLGTETQTPDPTIEADETAPGTTSAFRSLCYIVYPDRRLRDDQGQRHPTFKFEMHVEFTGYETDDVPADLQDIVVALCTRCGYDPVTQIDASELADVTVDGYAIQAVMAGRDALVPLRSVGFFDVVESGPKLKFVKRGGAPLRTLDATDMGVYDDPTNATPAPYLSVTEQQEVELPRQIRVSYISRDTDYQAGQQLSPSRFDTDAVEISDVELAVIMSDTQAVQTAEVLWNDAWQSKDSYTSVVDQSNADIEPTDVLLAPILGSTFRMRVTKVSDASQIMRTLTLSSDDDGAYVSTATADPPQRPLQTVSASSGSVLVLMDIPALQESDDDAGVYAVGYGDGTGNRWTGIVVYKSSDGDTFVQKATISGSPPMGRLAADLPAGDTGGFDDHNVVQVTMIKGQFESRTDEALYSGANTVAIGADGRWELVQFGTAVDLTDTSGDHTRLTHLVRGRRGTEWATGSGVAGDYVIGVTMGALFRITLQNTEIGAALTYKAVTIGSAYATGVDQVFTGHAVALLPFSPVRVRGKFVGSDFVITWIRRDRIGKTLAGVETAMSEATEAYSIDIVNGITVVRTLTSSTPTVTYLAADIITDFGVAPTQFEVRVYQLSAVVGRGTPEEAFIP